MRSVQFLKQSETQLMKADFNQLLASPEATLLNFNFNVGIGSLIPDPTYKSSKYTDGIAAMSITGMAIQKIVKLRDEHLLRFGILEIGDAIFYFSNTVDLTQSGSVIEGSLEIVDPGGVTWTPVPRNLGSFNNYIAYRLGNSQVAQVIACKIKK